MADADLRPLERRIRRTLASGVSEEEVARRFRRSPDWVRRVDDWTRIPRPGASNRVVSGLRPVERRVLLWRAQGADAAEIGARFRRGGPFIEQVERLAQYKLDR